MADGKKKFHKPNAIIALRSCAKCEKQLPKDVNDNASCKHCGGKKLWVWHAFDDNDIDIMADFCDWLFTNKGATVVAHNMKG